MAGGKVWISWKSFGFCSINQKIANHQEFSHVLVYHFTAPIYTKTRCAIHFLAEAFFRTTGDEKSWWMFAESTARWLRASHLQKLRLLPCTVPTPGWQTVHDGSMPHGALMSFVGLWIICILYNVQHIFRMITPRVNSRFCTVIINIVISNLHET